MRLFAIRDESMPEDAVIAYLIYHEIQNCFYIELPDNADPWIVPPHFSAFAERGEYSIGDYFSRMWVRGRIVPRDRQNITQLLMDNGLSEYDEFSLLMLAKGRCAQDDFYLEEISSDAVPDFLIKRWKNKVTEIIPLDVPKLMVFFQNDVTKIIDMQLIGVDYCTPFFSSQERFNTIEVLPGGYGVYWNTRACIIYSELIKHGQDVPLSYRDITRYVKNRLVNTNQTCDILECSRQNIDDLMKRGKLHPVRTDERYKLFTRAEVAERRVNKEA
jgi:hypothetical protein